MTVDSIDSADSADSDVSVDSLADPLPPPLVPGRFADVLQSCVLDKAPVGRPLCYDALSGITQGDIDTFRTDNPARSAELDRLLGDALGGVAGNHRVLALWLSLLLQDVDLLQHRTSTDVLHDGRGEAARRIAATLRQSARARDDRVAASVPTWAIVTIAVLGGLLLLALIVFGLGAAAIFG